MFTIATVLVAVLLLMTFAITWTEAALLAVVATFAFIAIHNIVTNHIYLKKLRRLK